ncbi:MAG: metalloregulator ArsR/SmtB family transcription factor [Clostridiales bacterium]|nr:metalloregulator ArsR/SmtB family transcription factor [Clostridiales bacterium]
MKKNYKNEALYFKALADETRLEIIEMLKTGELCACKILENFDITQPTLSYHMKILQECGLVSGRRDGAWMRYSLNKESFESMKNLFNELCLEMVHEQNSCCDQC